MMLHVIGRKMFYRINSLKDSTVIERIFHPFGSFYKVSECVCITELDGSDLIPSCIDNQCKNTNSGIHDEGEFSTWT